MPQSIPQNIATRIKAACGFVALEYITEKLHEKDDQTQLRVIGNANSIDIALDAANAYYLMAFVLGKIVIFEKTSSKKADTDLRNLLSTSINKSTRTREWGFDRTFNPKVQGGDGLPVLVHAFSAAKQVEIGSKLYTALEAHIDRTLQAQEGSVMVRPYFALLANPNTLQRITTSCSLISLQQNNKKFPTISPLGFIVNAPCWNIWAFNKSDLNVGNDAMGGKSPIELAQGHTSDDAAKDSQKRLHGTRPAELITQTVGVKGCDKYNEVALLGTSLFNTKIEVTGIFVKYNNKEGEARLVETMSPEVAAWMPEKTFYTGTLIDAVRLCAKTHNLPIVPIEDDSDDLFASEKTLASIFRLPNPPARRNIG